MGCDKLKELKITGLKCIKSIYRVQSVLKRYCCVSDEHQKQEFSYHIMIFKAYINAILSKSQGMDDEGVSDLHALGRMILSGTDLKFMRFTLLDIDGFLFIFNMETL